MKLICSHNLTRVFFISFFVLAATSCATIFSGANQNIRIKSYPEGANVFINGQNTYMHTPCKVEVKRRQKPSNNNDRNRLNIEVRKDGFKNSRLNVESSFNSLAGVSLLFAGFPFLIDWASGSHLKYPRNNYLVLDPVSQKYVEPMIAQDIVTPKNTVSYYFKSDIDYDIPITKKTHKNRFALIIGNEDYASFDNSLTTTANVKYARNDAGSFRDYAVNVLGIPEENITFLTDATLGKMKKGIAKLNLLAKNSYGEAELFFYYSGHGLPHEKTKEPYLIPVDVSGKDIDFAISLNDAFNNFTEFDTKKVTCFLDCCFSGGSRFGNLYETRGVRIVPKKANIKGNMVVFAASTSEQTALAYNDQKHGLFTYFLLKKFKESKGDVTYGDLELYLTRNIPIQSIIINEKEQSPQVNTGQKIDKNWKNWEF